MKAESWQQLVAPIGTLSVCTRNGHLTNLLIRVDPGAGAQDRSSDGGSRGPLADIVEEELKGYFDGHRRAFDLPLDLSACSPFTRKVLTELQRVPYGETVTYGELARRTGSPLAARAVGRAMATNPLPIIIPCHRVVAAGGLPGGYSGGGGLQTKEWLLAFERRNVLKK